MITVILWTIIRNEWRYITGLLLVIGLYAFIYHKGYAHCESAVIAAEAKATAKTQAAANIILQQFTNENTKQLAYSKSLEDRLHAILKNQPDCDVTPGAVRLLNEDGN